MLWTALILGMAGSFHCVGMCGPIGLMIPMHKNSKKRSIPYVLLYHLGRLSAYFSIGLLFGFLGKGLFLYGFQQRLSVLVGVLMIIVVLLPYSSFKTYNFGKPFYFLIAKIKNKLGYYIKNKSKTSSFFIGFFNGYLPCGLVYMALLGAISTATPLLGGFYMVVFGLGTIPLLSIFIFVGNFINLSIRNKIQKLVPVFVIIVGVLFILRGLGLGIPYLSPSDAKLRISNTSAECGIIKNVK
ncbi:MAG: sulfite exporter TauE/SafE family protein [Flavobacteriaceae bacterium]|nr:sulfite exporter TauE/SafE family protein [Flavobacteriaceae bacterium]